MKTLEAYKKALLDIKTLAGEEATDELTAKINGVVDGIDGHVKALNGEAKEHRVAKQEAVTKLTSLADVLGLDEGFSADDVKSKVDAIETKATENLTDADKRILKLENNFTALQKEKDDATALATKLKGENDNKTINGLVAKSLEHHNIINVHRELLTEKLSKGLVIDSDGEITNAEGIEAKELVKQFAEDPNNKGLIATKQRGGNGGTPKDGGSVTEGTVRSDLNEFVASMK